MGAENCDIVLVEMKKELWIEAASMIVSKAEWDFNKCK